MFQFTAVIVEPTSPSVDEDLNVKFVVSNYSQDPHISDIDLGCDDNEFDGCDISDIDFSGNNLVIYQLPAFPPCELPCELPSQLPSPTVNLQQAMLIEARHNGNRPNQSLQTGRYATLTNNHIEFVPNEILALVRGPWQEFLARFSDPDQDILQKVHRMQQNRAYATSYRTKAKKIRLCI